MIQPDAGNMVDKERCNQERDENTTYVFQNVYLDLSDIQTISLINAMRASDAWTITPPVVHDLSVMSGTGGSIGGQDQTVVQRWIVRDQDPQCLVCAGQMIWSHPN